VGIPARFRKQEGRHALVDGIPFRMPVAAHNTPALMAAFSINFDKAAALLPYSIHPLRWWRKALLVVTVVDYRATVIGKYIEFSVAIACTRGARPAPPILPLVFQGLYGMGQYVYDLPVSTEISVKGGKGIFGMPKHQSNLDFKIGERTVSSQYDQDGQMAVRIEIERPGRAWLPITVGAVNYCSFRGMIVKSTIYSAGKVGFLFFKKGSAKLCIGEHPRVQALKGLEINPDPLFVAFFPEIHGVLDDHVESWYATYAEPPETKPEGMESVINLGLSEKWLPPPHDMPDCKS
jgi:hypothetical protein